MRNAIALTVIRLCRKPAKRRSLALATPTRTAIRRRLLAWYDKNTRDLPWRKRESDAYAQWVAEIMLQQTRVDTVLRYYERFLDRFPTVAALARARETTVMKSWEGLGYYRRARNLHRAAKYLAENCKALPTTAETLQQLPGIGEYTAAAIASIAYGEVAAAIDGNVARVIARLFAIKEDVRATAGQRRVALLARELISPSRPGDFNQAWMDLGTMICTPQTPSCAVCPLKRQCVACATGVADRLPFLAKKKSPTPVNLLTILFIRRGRVLMIRNIDDGWWSGLWSFPSIERHKGRSLRQTLGDLAARHSLSIESMAKRTATVRHQLTHRTLNFDVRVCEPTGDGVKARALNTQVALATPLDPPLVKGGRKKRPLQLTVTCSNERNGGDVTDRKWVTPGQLEKLPVSTAHRKIWASIAYDLPL